MHFSGRQGWRTDKCKVADPEDVRNAEALHEAALRAVKNPHNLFLQILTGESEYADMRELTFLCSLLYWVVWVNERMQHILQ